MAGLKEEGPVVEKEAVLCLTTFLIDKVNLVKLVMHIFGVGSVKVVFILTTALREQILVYFSRKHHFPGRGSNKL